MKVELVAMTQPINEFVPNVCTKNPLEVVERCASVCYGSQPTNEYKIAKSCYRSGHLSTWEHISFTFHISGFTRTMLAQLSRHRHISLSVQSQRYCTLEDNRESYIPPTIAYYDTNENGLMQTYDKYIEDSFNAYKDLMSKYKIPKEDARYVLPNACTTELYMTANARALIEMSHLRLCLRAQDEIRTVFHMIKECVSRYCPEVAEYMVPTCETRDIPYCSEGKPCGKYPKLKQIIGEYNEKIYQLEKEIEELNDDISIKEQLDETYVYLEGE